MFKDKREFLVASLKREGRIKTEEVEKAFLEIPRENFIPERLKSFSYVDTPLEIGNGQTISAPHMVAIMCEALDIKKDQTILEIGAGSGYHAAVVSRLVGEKGHVYTVERFSSLAEMARNNLENTGIKNVTINWNFTLYRIRAGIEKKVTPHSFRHTFASRVYHNTKDIRAVQQLLGHSSISTTMIYTHVDDRVLVDAVNSIG